MSDQVKPRRRYDSSRRRAQAALTREDILAAAHEAFVERGYAAATVASIAKAAGVVVETVYRAFDGKAGLFRAVVEAAVAGGAARAESAPDDRPAIRALIAEPDPREQLRLYARTQPGIHERLGPLFRVVAAAAASDAELAGVWRELEDSRRAGMGRFAGLLAERGALHAGLSVDEAADLLWTLASHQVHELLVVQRGWSAERYRTWLAGALARELLP
jgi:AcrR family transcriptional regulator